MGDPDEQGLTESVEAMADESFKVRLQSSAPVFLVGNIASTMRWYQANLRFKADPFPESPPHAFCILSKDGVEIMLQQLAGYEKPDLYRKRESGVWDVYVRMQGVRELFQAVSKLGDVAVLEPARRPTRRSSGLRPAHLLAYLHELRGGPKPLSFKR